MKLWWVLKLKQIRFVNVENQDIGLFCTMRHSFQTRTDKVIATDEEWFFRSFHISNIVYFIQRSVSFEKLVPFVV